MTTVVSVAAGSTVATAAFAGAADATVVRPAGSPADAVKALNRPVAIMTMLACRAGESGRGVLAAPVIVICIGSCGRLAGGRAFSSARARDDEMRLTMRRAGS